MSRTQTKLHLDETHVWYELPLRADRPRLALRPELELVPGSANDLSLLEDLPTEVSGIEARLRMEASNNLWLVLDGRQPAFACWTYSNAVPVEAARNGHLILPPEIACLEDSVTSPSYRGRGTIAPAAWSQIANQLEKTGLDSLITKVEKDNKVMRWAVVRSGFREIATMRFRRVGPRERFILRSGTDGPVDWLAEQFMR